MSPSTRSNPVWGDSSSEANGIFGRPSEDLEVPAPYIHQNKRNSANSYGNWCNYSPDDFRLHWARHNGGSDGNEQGRWPLSSL